DSADGNTWTPLGSPQTVAMSDTAQVGLAVTATNNTALNTATFTNVAVTGSTLPAGWADADVGGPGIAGSASSPDGQSWTVKGGGGDIWGVSDQFNFASQALTGDGTIVARVASMDNTDPWAKAGGMFRDGTAAGAMFAGGVVTPGNGAPFQWRKSTSGQCDPFGVTGADAVAPKWVKLVRAGNTFTAYYSADGNTWTPLGLPQTVAMSGTAQVGLA